MEITTTNKFLLTLLLLASIVSGFYERDMWFNDEPRETGIAVRMAKEGNYAIPMLGNTQFIEKPPLYYWAAIPLLKLNAGFFDLGNVLRFESVLFGMSTFLVTFLLALLWAKHAKEPTLQRRSRYFALLTVIILASCNGFITNMLTIRTDIALTFFVALSALGFSLAYLEKKYSGSFIAALGLAGAFLCKGVIAFALVGLVWLPLFPFIISLIKEQRTQFLLPHFLTPLLTVFFITGLWIYFLIDQGGHSAWTEWFIENNVKRFVGGENVGHVQPGNYTYYIQHFITYTAPWGIFWVLGLVINFNLIRQKHFAMAVLQTWTILPLIFLTLATTRRPVYLLPILPFFAISVASLWIVFEPKILNKKLSPIMGKDPLLRMGEFLLVLIIITNLLVFPRQNERMSGHAALQDLFSKQSTEDWEKTASFPLSEGLVGYLYTYYHWMPELVDSVDTSFKYTRFIMDDDNEENLQQRLPSNAKIIARMPSTGKIRATYLFEIVDAKTSI